MDAPLCAIVVLAPGCSGTSNLQGTKLILIAAWAAAAWVVAFHQKNGCRIVSTDEKNRLLKK